MRLPADAALLIIDAQEAVDGPRHGAGEASEVETNIAALVAAWRTEGLPLAHVARQPGSSPHPPLDGEIVIVRNATSAFVGADLEARTRRTRRDNPGAMRRAGDPCARSIRMARSRPRLSGVCRRRRVPGGRHGRSRRAALAGRGRAGAGAGPSQRRDCDHRRRRDDAPGRRDGQGAPAARRGKGLTPLLNCYFTCIMALVWIFLVGSRLAAKTPNSGGWISLDFLGFSRQKRVFSIGYAGFSSKIFSPRFSPSRTP